jgi:hypothetical protein
VTEEREGYTKEKPNLDELGEPGTPGSGLTPDAPHAADRDDVEHGEPPADPVAATAVAHHDDATHMDKHTALSDDDHGHAESTLGPVDWSKWAYAIVGGIAGVIVIAMFWLALGGLPS